MVVMYGIAIDFNIKNIRLAVSDSDQTPDLAAAASRLSAARITFSSRPAGSPVDAVANVQGERAQATLIIPPRFEKDLFAGRERRGADPARRRRQLDRGSGGRATSARSRRIANERIAGFDPAAAVPAAHALSLQSRAQQQLVRHSGARRRDHVASFDPAHRADGRARMGERLDGAAAFDAGAAARDHRRQAERLTAVLGLVAVTLIYVIARVVFGVPFVGNHWRFRAGLRALPRDLSRAGASDLGHRAQSAGRHADRRCSRACCLRNLLSGFVFPVASMPLFFRYFTMILPARWFMEIARGTFLKGSSFVELWAAVFRAHALLLRDDRHGHAALQEGSRAMKISPRCSDSSERS